MHGGGTATNDESEARGRGQLPGVEDATPVALFFFAVRDGLGSIKKPRESDIQGTHQAEFEAELQLSNSPYVQQQWKLRTLIPCSSEHEPWWGSMGETDIGPLPAWVAPREAQSTLIIPLIARPTVTLCEGPRPTQPAGTGPAPQGGNPFKKSSHRKPFGENVVIKPFGRLCTRNPYPDPVNQNPVYKVKKKAGSR